MLDASRIPFSIAGGMPSRKDKHMTDDATYKIVRMYRDGNEQHTVKRGLTLDEAQAWCNDPETSSRTATSPEAEAITKRYGPWFDGYTVEQ